MMFGASPADVKTFVLFVPKFEENAHGEQAGFVVTFNKAYDLEKLKTGVQSAMGKDEKVQAKAVSNRTAAILVNFPEKAAEPAAEGPLSAALLEAASGKHAAVLGIAPASFPAVLRDDNCPLQLRPFQPLFKATAVTATLDLKPSIELSVTVKTATAGQAVECEKALGTLLGLAEEALAEEQKEIEKDKTAKTSPKDLLAVMSATAGTLKKAKYSTLGNETQLTLSLPSDLPFGTAYLSAREHVEKAVALEKSANNLKQIALATMNYADSMNGNLPPAAVCDKSGKPLLSWRVLILPYIEEEQLFKQFKLDEAWDSAHNKKLLAKMPSTYAIPAVTKPGDTDTHYRVFVGKGAGWDWVQGARFPQSFTDGTSQTILCVTAAEAVPWTKPDELEFDPNKDMRKQLGAIVQGKVQVAMFDGSVHILKKMPSQETIHALITRASGDIPGPDFP